MLSGCSGERFGLSLVGLVVVALVTIGAGSCASELECGERNLPGTEACPCLPGGRCAADLVCEANVCHERPVDRPEDDDGDESPDGETSTMSTDGDSDSADTGNGTDTSSTESDLDSADTQNAQRR